jgi:hypothetical protein
MSAKKLPVRPASRDDEWTETYLGRLARANGVRRPWRDDLESVRYAVPDHLRTRVIGAPEYELQSLPGWATVGKGARIRYCPACFSQSRHIRARWRISMFDVCTIHDLCLKNDLCEPAITANYHDPGKKRISEITDEEIWEGAICPLPATRQYAQLLWSDFEKAFVGELDGSKADFVAWSLLAERLVDAVVTAVRGPDYPPKNVARLAHRANWLVKTGWTLGASEKGVLGFLLSLQLNIHRRAAASCLRHLIQEEVRQKTVLTRLPLQYLYDRLLAMAPEAIHPPACGALPRALHPPGYISLDQTEALLGCTFSLLYFLVQKNFFTRVEKIRCGRKQYIFLHRSDVEACRRWLASCMTYDEVIHILQIDRPAYWMLLDSQLLNPLKLGSWCRHRRQDVYSLIDRLDSVSRPYPVNGRRLLPLMGDWLYSRNRPRISVTQVLNEIWRGEFPLYRKPDEAGLRAYFVDETAVIRLHKLAAVQRADRFREVRCAGQQSLIDGLYEHA